MIPLEVPLVPRMYALRRADVVDAEADAASRLGDARALLERVVDALDRVVLHGQQEARRHPAGASAGVEQGRVACVNQPSLMRWYVSMALEGVPVDAQADAHAMCCGRRPGPRPVRPVRLSRFQRRSTHRVAELLVEAVRELVDARGDLVEVHGLLAPVALHYVHGHCETLGGRSRRTRTAPDTNGFSANSSASFENKTRTM